MPRNHTKLQPPKPDVEGPRAPFAAIVEPLQPRANENDRAYAAMLLWCMMAPSERSKRMLAKAMGIGESTIRYWSSKHAWNRRMALVQNPEWEALKGYRHLMDLQTGTGEAAALRVAMDVVLDRAGLSAIRHTVMAQRQGRAVEVPGGSPGGGEPSNASEEPQEASAAPQAHRHKPEAQAANAAAFSTPLSDNELQTLDATKHMVKLRESILREHLTVKDVKRQIMLIDGCLGLIAKKVQTGELEVKLSDIPQLLKARALLTGLPTEQVAVQHQHDHNHSVVVESARMRDARKKGGTELLAAMQDELNELNVIMGAMPRPRMIDVTPGEKHEQ